jgi:predicted  nucleic acid-binding Zn-ribbon protein
MKEAGRMSQAQKESLFMNSINEPAEQDLKLQLAEFSNVFQSLTIHLKDLVEEINPLPQSLVVFSENLKKTENKLTFLIDKQKETTDFLSKLGSLEEKQKLLNDQYDNLSKTQVEISKSLSWLRENIITSKEYSDLFSIASNGNSKLESDLEVKHNELRVFLRQLKTHLEKTYTEFQDLHKNNINALLCEYNKEIDAASFSSSELFKEIKLLLGDLNSDIHEIKANSNKFINVEKKEQASAFNNKFSDFLKNNLIFLMIITSLFSGTVVSCIFLVYFQNQIPRIIDKSLTHRK